MSYICHRLPSGLGVVIDHQPSARAEYCGMQVRAGTRQETDPSEWGLAHFVEHTIFKGTQRHRAWYILNRMEAVGGELNAYTTKEETVVYSAFPAGCLRRAMGLICDLVTDSVFPPSELDRERDVVLDEVASYLDMPSDAVYDDFEDLLFRGTSLGHNILGTEEAIRGFDSQMCRQWLQRWYRPDRFTFFYSGAEKPDKVISWLNSQFTIHNSQLAPQYLSDGPESSIEHCALSIDDEVRDIGSHQAHTLVGARVPGIIDNDQYPLALLINILGGPGMNSLLNVALRERRGLVYAVEASTTLYSDTGMATIYMGCDPEDVDRCLRLVKGILQRVVDKPFTPRQLDAYKRQYIGQQQLAAANAEQCALNAARSMMYHGRVSTLDEITANIAAITPQEVQQAAQLLDPSRLSRLTLL